MGLETLELCKWFAKQWGEWTVLLFIFSYIPNLQTSTCFHKNWQALRWLDCSWWLLLHQRSYLGISEIGRKTTAYVQILWHGKNSAATVGMAALGTFLWKSTKSVLLWPLCLPFRDQSTHQCLQQLEEIRVVRSCNCILYAAGRKNDVLSHNTNIFKKSI